MPSDMILIVGTARHRYAIRRDDVLEIRLVLDSSAMPQDKRGQPYLGIELGPMLDPQDQSTMKRRRALVIPLRRRLIAFLTDSIDALQEQVTFAPLPELLRTKLKQPWAVGALVLNDEVIVQLDLLAIARSALAKQSS
jgi:chemotaxis signal transduction protein